MRFLNFLFRAFAGTAKLLFSVLRWLGRPTNTTLRADREPEAAAEPEMEPHWSDPVSPSRRSFLTKISVAMGGLGAAIVGLPVVGVLISPVVRRDEDAWRDVGAVSDFPIGDTISVNYLEPDALPWAGFAAESAAYVRRVAEQQFTAFSIYCSHTGCPVRWIPNARLFLCPCHGGVFDDNGAVTSGPPPRPLDRFPVRVRGDRVQIQTIPIPLPENSTPG